MRYSGAIGQIRYGDPSSSFCLCPPILSHLPFSTRTHSHYLCFKDPELSYVSFSAFLVFFNPVSPTLFFWLWQKWVYQSVQRHTGLTYLFIFLTFGHCHVRVGRVNWNGDNSRQFSVVLNIFETEQLQIGNWIETKKLSCLLANSVHTRDGHGLGSSMGWVGLVWV